MKGLTPVLVALLVVAVCCSSHPARAATTREALAAGVEKGLLAQFLANAGAPGSASAALLKARAHRLASAALSIPVDTVDDGTARWLHDDIMRFCSLGDWLLARDTPGAAAREAEFSVQLTARLKVMTPAEAARLRALVARTWAGQLSFAARLRSFVADRLSRPGNVVLLISQWRRGDIRLQALVKVAESVGLQTDATPGEAAPKAADAAQSRALTNTVALLVTQVQDSKTIDFDNVFSPAFDSDFPVRPDAYTKFDDVEPSIAEAWDRCFPDADGRVVIDVSTLLDLVLVVSTDRFPAAGREVTRFKPDHVLSSVAFQIADSTGAWQTAFRAAAGGDS